MLDAEVRIGELMAQVPKGSGGDHGNQYTGGKNNIGDNFAKTKEKVIAEAGFTPMQVSRFETMDTAVQSFQETKADVIEQSGLLSKWTPLSFLKLSLRTRILGALLICFVLKNIIK